MIIELNPIFDEVYPRKSDFNQCSVIETMITCCVSFKLPWSETARSSPRQMFARGAQLAWGCQPGTSELRETPETNSFLRVKHGHRLVRRTRQGGATVKHYEWEEHFHTNYSLTKIKPGDPINDEGWISHDFLKQGECWWVKNEKGKKNNKIYMSVKSFLLFWLQCYSWRRKSTAFIPCKKNCFPKFNWSQFDALAVWGSQIVKTAALLQLTKSPKVLSLLAPALIFKFSELYFLQCTWSTKFTLCLASRDRKWTNWPVKNNSHKKTLYFKASRGSHYRTSAATRIQMHIQYEYRHKKNI